MILIAHALLTKLPRSPFDCSTSSFARKLSEVVVPRFVPCSLTHVTLTSALVYFTVDPITVSSHQRWLTPKPVHVTSHSCHCQLTNLSLPTALCVGLLLVPLRAHHLWHRRSAPRDLSADPSSWQSPPGLRETSRSRWQPPRERPVVAPIPDSRTGQTRVCTGRRAP